MLVLSRKQDQTINIGNGIVIRICGVKGSTVRIGIEAPPEIKIMRGELSEFHELSFEPTRAETPDTEYALSASGRLPASGFKSANLSD